MVHKDDVVLLNPEPQAYIEKPKRAKSPNKIEGK
jgi:hypothetical protein